MLSDQFRESFGLEISILKEKFYYSTKQTLAVKSHTVWCFPCRLWHSIFWASEASK